MSWVLSDVRLGAVKLQHAARYDHSQIPDIIKATEKALAIQKTSESSWFDDDPFNKKSELLNKQWKEIRLFIDQGKIQHSEKLLTEFYQTINDMFPMYRKLGEERLIVIYAIEVIEFVLSALIVIFLFYYSKKHIITPVNRLLDNAKAIKNHSFKFDFPHCDNEIGLLADGMRDMSVELEKLLTGMQEQVQQKTLELEKANTTIEFLFSISQQLNTVKLTSPILYNTLNALGKQANLSKLCLELNSGYFIKSELDCASVYPEASRSPIVINGKTYGYLNYVQNDESQDCASLIESFSGLVARALYQDEYTLQTQKISLMEERSVIARELHDSIAQSLSFLKIQCAVLQKQVGQTDNPRAIQTIDNVKSAIAEAYTQLRSLLSTFRLNVPESNFRDALETMVESLRIQSNAQITLSKFKDYFHTTPNQHIHLLQIIREATVNAIKHAQCKHIDISCIITDEDKVWISIVDDGRGIRDNSSQEGHYGLSIMKQRADELGATLSIIPLQHGTEVKLIFPYKNKLLKQGIENV
ncbi:histidine kinase [Psychromonas ossibalaenae]|uniref:histidine kinase n=1 Tax=Psychromonas ossibalaenae TaxID=444922 RepID=UPI0003807A7F|nr:histidine kinase [Psychromonas ossibalaenae]